MKIVYLQYVKLSRLNICILLFLGFINTAQAQFVSVRGLFEVDQVKGCTGLTVNIVNILNTATDCSSGDCNFDYQGDGINDTQSNPFTFTYNDAGDNVYWLTILFPNNANAALEGFDSIRIEVVERLPPTFDIWSCAGESITVNITDTNYDLYRIEYGDGAAETVAQGDPNPQHAYANNIARILTMQGVDINAAENCPVASKTINPLNTLPSAQITSISAIDNQTLVLEYNLTPDILYRLDIDPNSDNSFNFLRNLSAQSTRDTIRNLDLINNFYCFRINTIDPCLNTVAQSSNTVCSIEFAIGFDNNVNNLTWSTEDPDVNFSIIRDGALLTNTNAGLRNFGDTDVLCNTDYCYQIIANYNSSVTSTSTEICGTSVSNLPSDPVSNISLQVEGNGIQVIWQEPVGVGISQYELTRVDEGVPVSLGNITETQFRDSGLATDLLSVCYRVSTSDDCGNSNAQSIQPCSILLSGTIDAANNVSLNWNSYTGWSDGVTNYTVEKSYPNNGLIVQNVNGTTFDEQEINDQFQVIQYRVIANPIDAAIPVAISNVITLIKGTNLYNPTAFTPDGDGLNDTFALGGNFIASYELKIFTRWGELVFSSTNKEEGWNGKREGRDLPEGTYAFRAKIVDLAGREVDRFGTVVLLRN